jgi:methyl-galactoside transport system ATP-binding protein
MEEGEMSNDILEMNHITKVFPGVRALDDVSLKVKAGSVHSLMGENGAGKSTLMKCLFGIYTMDQGSIILGGEPVVFASPKQALAHGVAMVHQELNQVSTRPVMENIWLGRFPKTKLHLVDHRKMYQMTLDIFQDLGISIDPKAKISSLPVSKRQMVEIAKAVSLQSRIIVFDEPTSSLTEVEVEQLFGIIRTLKKRGCGIIYISHKINEILKIADEVTVMRDGKWIATTPASMLTNEMLIKQMVGRELKNVYPEKQNIPKEPVLSVKNLTTEYLQLKDISFFARRGEILGFSGLNGSGKTEMMESLFGLTTLKSGKIEVRGKTVRITNSRKAIKCGFAYLAEERRKTGIFGVLSVQDNITLTNSRNYLKARFYLSENQMAQDAERIIGNLRIKTPSRKQKILSLSGGNQQKTIVGKWILTSPEIYLLDEPTRGIDVGAKYEIYQLMIELASSGKTILMVSSEMQELLGVCDRIIVLSGGRIAGEVDPKSATQEDIMTLAAKYV